MEKYGLHVSRSFGRYNPNLDLRAFLWQDLRCLYTEATSFVIIPSCKKKPEVLWPEVELRSPNSMQPHSPLSIDIKMTRCYWSEERYHSFIGHHQRYTWWRQERELLSDLPAQYLINRSLWENLSLTSGHAKLIAQDLFLDVDYRGEQWVGCFFTGYYTHEVLYSGSPRRRIM